MMKYLFLLLVILVFTSAYVAPVQRRPSFVVDSTRFLHPDQAKDLEAYAHTFFYQTLQQTVTEKTNEDLIRKQRNGPVAWCRRMLQSLRQA
jgi:uncharacterized membrane protein YgcG